MNVGQSSSGYTSNGLPYNRFGDGPKQLVVFVGLVFENKPLDGLDARYSYKMYEFLTSEYTVWLVPRKPGLPQGYSIGDMADDYAAWIAEEFDGPVDIIGTSTGGSICQPFAADHPQLVRRLVIHSGAHTLGPLGKKIQVESAEYAAQGRWRKVGELMMGWVMRPKWYGSLFAKLFSPLMAMSAPDDPSDLIATIRAEDVFEFRDRLGEIAAPTLVAAGHDDPGYSPELFRETADGIPLGMLKLYADMGHPAKGAQFQRDVLAFLRAEE